VFVTTSREIPTILRLHASALVIAALLAAGCEPTPTREWTPADHGQPTAPAAGDDARMAEAAAPEGPDEDPELRAARALWVAACASCHGRQGRGDGPSPPPGARVPDLTLASTLAGKTDAQLAAVISDGRGMMPGFGKQIVPAGIDVLVQHVRSLGAATAPADRDAPAPEAPAPSAVPTPTHAPAEGAR
jgi:mono/diheme cytochrome c family protein